MRTPTDKVISLTSLALLLSLAETFIPRPLPFFRLGLANIPLLIALGHLSFSDYLALTLLKALSSSYISGTLISPFFMVSLSQSMASGMVMLALYTLLKRHISLYGLSLAGAAVSSSVQIFIASLILGKGVLSLFPIMLILSFFSSLVTAYLAKHMPFDIERPISCSKSSLKINKSLTLILFLLILTVSHMRNIAILLIALVLMAAISIRSGRKVKVINYLVLILISVFSALLTPRGKILFEVLNFPISEMSLSEGLKQGLRLSLIVMISLTFSRYILSGGFFSLILRRFFSMEKAFYSAEGSLKNRVIYALNADACEEEKSAEIKIPYLSSVIILVIFIALKAAELIA